MFLDGLTVLEIGAGTSGAWAGATLRDLGATVLRAPLGGGTPESPYLELLAQDKHRVDAATVAEALGAVGRVDVVVLDRVGDVPGDVPADLKTYRAVVAALNPAVWVTISAYGLTGPDASEFGSDYTVCASAGVLAYVRDGRGRPRSLPGQQALLAAGQVAVLAALHGIDRRSADHPLHLDVSAQEAMIATGPVLQCAERMLKFVVRGGAKRFGSPAGWYDCTDGRVYIATHEDHQWEGIKRAIRPPEPIASWHTAAERIEHSAVIDEFVSKWVAGRTKDTVESELQAAGVPATALNSLDDVRESAKLAFRGRWRTDRIAGRTVRTMGAPYIVRRADGTAEPDGRPVPRRLTELRVAEASHILAGSMAGALLGVMGADVVKIEDVGRLDQYRRSGPFIDGHEDLEWSGYFAIANHSKHSLAVRDRSEVERIVASADAVIENWGTSRSRRYGLDSESVGRRWPAKLAVSSSGFGHEGPLADYRVYAYNLNGWCGLLDTLSGSDGSLPGLDFAWADFVSAFGIATLVAAWVVGGGSRDDGTPGAQVDSAMAEVVVQRLNALLVEADSGAPTEAPVDLLFETDGGSARLAVTLRRQHDRKHLASLLGTDTANDDELRTGLRPLAAADIASALRRAGIPARTVLDADDLIADRHLADRGFFAAVDHPAWDTRRIIGVPWRFADAGPLSLRPPPLLGDANADGPWRHACSSTVG